MNLFKTLLLVLFASFTCSMLSINNDYVIVYCQALHRRNIADVMGLENIPYVITATLLTCFNFYITNQRDFFLGNSFRLGAQVMGLALLCYYINVMFHYILESLIQTNRIIKIRAILKAADIPLPDCQLTPSAAR